MTFITKTDLESFANKYSEENDPNPQRYCDSAMEEVKNYLGYDPESQSYTQTVKGDGGLLAALQAMPITAITALTVDGETADPTDLEVQSENYVCFSDGSVFQKGARYVITFTAGFTSIPEVIKTTALQLATLFWESAGGNLAVSSTSFADTGSRVFNNFTADRFLKQIAQYKRRF